MNRPNIHLRSFNNNNNKYKIKGVMRMRITNKISD